MRYARVRMPVSAATNGRRLPWKDDQQIMLEDQSPDTPIDAPLDPASNDALEALLRDLRDPELLRHAVLELDRFPFTGWSKLLLHGGNDTEQHLLGPALLAVVQYAHRSGFDIDNWRQLAPVCDLSPPAWAILRRYPLICQWEWVPKLTPDGVIIESVIRLTDVDENTRAVHVDVQIGKITAVDGTVALHYRVSSVERQSAED